MPMLKGLFSAIFACLLAAPLAAQTPLRIAAAADLQPVLPPILVQFEKNTGIHAEATYQASAMLTTEIENGAPFDLFLSANRDFVDKLAATKLTPVRSELVDAPYVKEFPLIVECKLAHVIELGLHTQFVGEVMDVKAEESVMAKGGLLEIAKVKPLVFAPDTQAYYGIGHFVGQAFSVGRAFE